MDDHVRRSAGRADRDRNEVATPDILDALKTRLGPRATAAQLLEAVSETAQLLFGETGNATRPPEVEAVLISPQVSGEILHNLHDGIIVADRDSRILLFNEAAEAIFACTRADVIGRPLRDLFPTEPWTEAWPRTEGTNGAVRLAVRQEGVARRRNGEVFPVEISAALVGKVVVITATDLTERKTIEAESIRRLQILQSIIDNMPGGVSVFDGNLEMIICNRMFHALLEFPPELFADGLPSFRTLIEFNARRGEYGPGDVEALVATSVERARNPVPHVYERQRPEGSILEIRGMPLPGGGFVTIYNDITDRKRAEDEAKRYATYLRTVLDSMPQGISVFDENLELALWNQSFVEVLDLPPDIVKEGASFVDLIRFNAERGEYGNQNTSEYVKWRTRMAMRFEPHSFERLRPNGRSLDIQGRPIRIGGKIAGFVTTHTDITKSKQADELVRRAGELMDDAIGYSPTYVWEVNGDGCFTFLKGTPKVLGYEAEELLGRRFSDLECGATQCHEHSSLLEMAFEGRAPFQHLLSCARHKDGSHVWISVSAHPIFDRNGGFIGYRGVNVDVTELTRVRQELERMALHDPLTGLANRRKFLERFRLEVARQKRHGRSLALLVADIDHFKAVNDQFGHLTGDMCLKCVADVLSMAVRKIDIVARFGGEEFIILLPETSPDGAITTAEKLRHAVEALNIPIDARFEPLNITVSIGVACLPAGFECSFDDLTAIADQGLYGAKQAGRNRVMMYRRLDEE